VGRSIAHTFRIRAIVQAAILMLVVLMPLLVVVVLGIGLFDGWYDFRVKAVSDFFETE
jgi:hypothetical protein